MFYIIGDGKLSRFQTDCQTDCDEEEPQENSSKTVDGNIFKPVRRVIAHDDSLNDELNFIN